MKCIHNSFIHWLTHSIPHWFIHSISHSPVNVNLLEDNVMMDGWTDIQTDGTDRQADRSLRAKTDEWPHKISLDINPKTRMRCWDIPHYANTFVRSIIEEIFELFVQSLAHTPLLKKCSRCPRKMFVLWIKLCIFFGAVRHLFYYIFGEIFGSVFLGSFANKISRFCVFVF